MKVEAGAGTGKTTEIVSLLLQELLIKGTGPHAILALTFTVKAAAEMRERLRMWLGRLLEGQKIVELGHRDLEAFIRWKGGDPGEAARRGPEALSAIDQMEIGTIHSFAGHLLRLYPVEAGVPPDFSEDDGRVFEELFGLAWERWKAGRLGEAPLERILEVAALEDLQWLARGLCAFGTPLEVASAPGFADRLRALAAEAIRLRQRVPPGKNAALRALEAAAVVFADPESPGRPELSASFPDKWSTADREEARDLLKSARRVLQVDDALAVATVAWLRPFVESFRREYVARGSLSFDGMIHYARELLRDNEEVRGRLESRFSTILVDEFQDTDPGQGELILMLAGDRLNKVTIVGDPKQSIYLFRGADLEAYDEFRDRLPGETLHKDENWRSRPSIIAFVNAVFPEFRPLRVSKERSDKPGSVELLYFPDLSAGEAREAEAEAIARMIRREVDAKTWRYRHYAVLFRALSDTHLYLEVFRRHGVEFAIEGGKYFFASPEVVDFVNLLRAILDPADRAARVGLLRSPLGGLSDQELMEGQGDPALEATLAELRELAGRARIDAWAREIFRRLPVLEVAAATYRGEQAVANILRLLELAMEDPSRTPAAFIRECAARIREEHPFDEGALADEQLDVVRILSIHKAKGLEFPVVILPDLHRQPHAPERPEAVRVDRQGRLGVKLGDSLTAGRLLMDEAFERKERLERERILYVAMTRARERLVLSGTRARHSFMDLILSRMDELPAAGTHRVRAGGAEVAVTVGGAPKAAKARARKPPKPAFDPERLEELWRARERVEAAPAIVTPSSLVEKRVHLADHDEPEKRDEAAAVGTVCHALLARIDFAAPSLEPVEALARRYAPRGRHAEVAREARAILEKFAAAPVFAELARAKILGRELPFVRPSGTGVMTGQMDLVIDRGAGPEIVDYKSDRAENPESYAAQGRAYSEALGGAPFSVVYLRSGRKYVVSSA